MKSVFLEILLCLNKVFHKKPTWKKKVSPAYLNNLSVTIAKNTTLYDKELCYIIANNVLNNCLRSSVTLLDFTDLKNTLR